MQVVLYAGMSGGGDVPVIIPPILYAGTSDGEDVPHTDVVYCCFLSWRGCPRHYADNSYRRYRMYLALYCRCFLQVRLVIEMYPTVY